MNNDEIYIQSMLLKDRKRFLLKRFFISPLIFGKRILEFIRNPKKSIQYHKNYHLIKTSGILDENYYLTHYPDLIITIADLTRHYLLFGAWEGKNPNPYFDSNYYREENPFLDSIHLNPAIHYLTQGIYEGQLPSPDFELNYDNLKKLLRSKFLNKYNIDFNNLNSRKKSNSKRTNSISRKEPLSFSEKVIKLKQLEYSLISWEKEIPKKRHPHLVSVIIPVYDKYELTENCLNSIFQAKSIKDYEIIIVNNNPSDLQQKEKLDHWQKNPHLRIIHSPENLSFALGCNYGFSVSMGRQVIFLNNDTLVSDFWIDRLVEPLIDRNISAVQPKLIYQDHTVQSMGIVFSAKSDVAFPLYQGIGENDPLSERDRLLYALTGACFAIEAADFSKLKGFDCSYINGQEDVDFFLRLNLKDNRHCLYRHDVTLFHFEGKSKNRGKFVIQNRKLFIQRWKKHGLNDAPYQFAQDGLKAVRWDVDSPVFKKFSVNSYLPVLEKGKKLSEQEVNSPDYYIKGERNFSIDKAHILIAAHSLSNEIYGGERSFLDMIHALSRGNYNITVVLPNFENKAYLSLLLPMCNHIYKVYYPFWHRDNQDKRAIAELKAIMQINSISLVYVNSIMCKEPLFAARDLNIKSVTHIRELIDQDKALQKTILLPLEKIIEKVKQDADYLIFNSRKTAELFSQSPSSYILHNRIDVDQFQAKEKTDPFVHISLISSNVPKKGLNDFLELATLCSTQKNALFHLIGPKNVHTENLKMKIIQRKLSNFIIEGYKESPQDAIGQSDIVLSLSHFAESFGRTIGEAMASYRAVIAYSRGALPELIDEGINGYLCEPDNIEQVAQQVIYLCNNREKINEIGMRGRDKIEKLSSDSVYTTTMLKIMDSIILDEKDRNKKKIAVIVPVYNAYEEFTLCMDSLLKTVNLKTTNILIINDNSPDNRIKAFLSKYEHIPEIQIVHNEKNLGYTNSINKGISLCMGQDIILLNSDTITIKNWVESLYSVAYSQEKIGTVTAMSNNAGAFSFPKREKENYTLSEIPHETFAKAILKQTELLEPPTVPTGSGFCMYIKRELFNQIGLFDAARFPRGYGEENDFCMRAKEKNWKNVISPKTYIFHVRSASFKKEKTTLAEEGIKKVLERFPQYRKEVQRDFNSNIMNKLREKAEEGLSSLYYN